ncbi:MAG: glycosyltransferase family 1 protein [Caldilinea sp. CFX5]|nr:glycosyltransferase family 1 protein [Caldilinea sp. CFX5]
MQDLICISHLRWDFVWQRPQQLLSRLAKQYRIFFVEEPVTDTDADKPYLETYPGRTPGARPVTVVKMHYPSTDHYWIGHNDPRTQADYEALLLDIMAQEEIHSPLVWLYTPMAAPFAEALRPQLLIYDVMDELSAFKGAPAELKEADRRLLGQADLVFTGGASLYRTRQPYSNNIHLFPSGVAIEHFARADREHFEKPADIAGLQPPILGYFGVIDERMDLELLTQVANAHPEWNLLMLGPVIKIAPQDLPQAPNLHYPGMKDYNELPVYLAYFDVALVPFAMNEATRFLSPTKTLEYLAAHKPVVATPIPDIIELYGDYVRIGQTPAAFINQIAAALAAGDAERAERRRREQQLLTRYTWDSIANRMAQLIADSYQRKTAPKRVSAPVGASPVPAGSQT